jgi:phosphoglycerate dehydrogenase-like enzyme
MKVLLTVPVTDEQFQRICEAAGDAVVVRGGTPEIDEREIADAEVVFGRFNRRLFERAQRLRWVQTLGAGVDGLLFPEFVESDIVLTSEKGHVGPHLAEQAFANLLALTRGVARAIRERTWENKWQIRQAAWELTGMTMGEAGARLRHARAGR